MSKDLSNNRGCGLPALAFIGTMMLFGVFAAIGVMAVVARIF